MAEKKAEPNVYSETDGLRRALDNSMMTEEENAAYMRRIDASRVAVPKKQKKKPSDDDPISQD